jgi:hypothetical protein
VNYYEKSTITFHSQKEVNTMGNLKYYLPGSILILLAIIIALLPEILVAIVAASMIMLGVGALHIGHMIRKSAFERRDFARLFVVDDPLEGWSNRPPIFRRWY